MALWGAGDPRWLVEHRDDGKNVNGWHWEEKNKIEWAKVRLAELFSGLDAGLDEASQGALQIERVKDIVGDAALTTRKGNKKFAVFDLKITLGWKGQAAGSEKEVKGEIKIEEVHSTGDEDDYVYSATVEGSGQEQDKLKRFAEGDAVRRRVFATIAQFVTDFQNLCL